MASNPILVITEASFSPPEIVEVLYPTSYEEGSGENNEISMMNTMGKIVPLVKINNKIIEQGDIRSMRLESSCFLPTLSLSFYDRNRVTTLIDTPGPDDYIHIQIIPRFDGIYKKINLIFYINSISMDLAREVITIDAVYSIEGLNNSVLKSYGKIDTYTYYNTIAQELNMGFCSNITSGSTEDNRYLYISNDTYLNSLKKEFTNGGSDLVILDSWIDFYNNINLVDLYDLYYAGENWTDQPEAIMIHASHSFTAASADTIEEPYEIEAIITNNPKFQITELYADKLKMKSYMYTNRKIGTDIGINVYDMDKNIQSSKLFQDGTGIETNIYSKIEYRGEFNPLVCDNSNYLFQSDVYKLFISKMDNNLIEVETPKVIFGLMRGGKVNLEWYDNSELGSTIQEASSMEMNSNIKVDETNEEIGNVNAMKINKRLSGQYIIVSTEIKYNMVAMSDGTDYNMRQKFTLSRVVNSSESRYTKTI